MTHTRGRATRGGFTLIELLVVLAIISLLLTIALPRYFGSVEKSKEVALKENLRLLRGGIDKFYADKGEYPSALSELVAQRYFRAVPVDPVTESAGTWQLLTSPDGDKPGVADIRSGAKGKTRDGTPFEQL
ncbi:MULTISPECIES: type II secretion system protein [unclassified Janthinobacterium]|uniref:type II secretion system protein n=1 Tax=unclassified Janthinobacterium TaxID=2610881 RepID=UPI00034D1A1F|nr:MULTISPECIES: type II secretion system protein [unclassified Janthinobacterium]MEC5161787.1 general secretion pathway protein G [Janthinobacterium sp. CG_S6]